MPRSWKLSYPGVSLDLGDLDDAAAFVEAPEIGPPELTSDDAARPRGDGVAFGIDYEQGRTITLTLGVGAPSEAETRSRLATLASAWRAERVRKAAGSVATLRIAGATAADDRLVFGRPRRFARVDRELLDGYAEVVADFATSDSDFYSPTESSQTVTFAPSLGGGIVAPLVAPISTTADSDRSTNISVVTDLPAWPVVTIHGPITNPDVLVLGVFRFAFNAVLAYDESVTIDSSPWARSILKSDGSSLAGKITRTSTRLAKAAIPAGSYDLSLRGQDSTGTSSASVRWRGRYSSV